MGNCYARQQSQNNRNFIDKNIRVQCKIGAEVSICKSAQKIGLDANAHGTLTTTREETYANNIPAIVDIVNESTQTL